MQSFELWCVNKIPTINFITDMIRTKTAVIPFGYEQCLAHTSSSRILHTEATSSHYRPRFEQFAANSIDKLGFGKRLHFHYRFRKKLVFKNTTTMNLLIYFRFPFKFY